MREDTTVRYNKTRSEHMAVQRKPAEKGPTEQNRPLELRQIFIARFKDDSKVLDLRD